MNEDWVQVIAQGETMRVDFKGPMAWSGIARASLAEDIVAMSNIRDGGLLLIGVSESEDGGTSVEGVTPDQSSTFDPTTVCDFIASYFQPPVRLTIERPELASKQLIVIRVFEFDASPVICVKDGPEKPTTGGRAKRYFYAGNLIVRSPAAKSEVIRTAEDMHALIRLGVAKTSNQLLADFRRVLEGTTTSPPALPHQRELAFWSDALAARRALWATGLPGRGSIAMTLLPSSIGRSLDHAEMRKVVQDSQVHAQGWSLPSQTYEDRFVTIQNRVGVVEGTYDLDGYQEIWQQHASGAFMFSRVLHYVDDLDEHGQARLPFEDIIHPVALGVLFAQRLYQRLIPDGEVDLEFSILGTKGQTLGTFDSFRRHMPNSYRSGDDAIVSHVPAPVIDLRSAWRPIAHRVIRELFVLFNWQIAPVAVDQRLDEVEGKSR